MVPPKLNVVPHRQDRDDSNDDDVMRELTHTPAPESARGLPSNIAQLPSADRREQLRILEALLFAASEPLAEAYLASHLKSDDKVPALLEELQGFYASRGINLMRVAGKWAFRTAEDLAYLLERHATEQRKLSKAAMETLAIIAYHQPVTRAEIEEIRGVAVSAGTIDVLMEVNWVRPRGRRRAPGRPITYGTTDQFLEHFGFDGIKDLPGLTELKGSGLLSSNLPPDFTVPEPNDAMALMPDELPLDAGEEETGELPLGEATTTRPEGRRASPPERRHCQLESSGSDRIKTRALACHAEAASGIDGLSIIPLRLPRILGQLLDVGVSEPPVVARFGLPLHPAVDCRCVPIHERPRRRLGLVLRVHQSRGRFDLIGIERAGRRCDLLLLDDFRNSGRAVCDA